jgi:hypothetical protein
MIRVPSARDPRASRAFEEVGLTSLEGSGRKPFRTPSNCYKPMKKPGSRCREPGRIVEAAGIAPASREASARASTCVADRLIVGLGAPVGRVPFGLSRHEFNPSCNKRLGSGYPELASPAGSLGRRPGARPSLFFRQRDGDQQSCWQLSFGRLFTRPADQPRHATVHFGHPVDPGSPPDCALRVRSARIGRAGRAGNRFYYSRYDPEVKGVHRFRNARSMSRFASCFLRASRLSYVFRPRATESSTFAMPFLK